MTHGTEHERSLRRSCWDKKVIDYFCEARANWLSGKVCHGEQVLLKRSSYSEHANIMKFRLHRVTQAPRGDRQRSLPAGLTVVVQRQLLRGLQQRLQYSVGRRRQEPGDHSGWPGHFLHSASLHRFRNQQRKREIDSADGRKSSAATKTKHTRHTSGDDWGGPPDLFSKERSGVSLIFMRSPHPIGPLAGMMNPGISEEYRSHRQRLCKTNLLFSPYSLFPTSFRPQSVT